MWAAIFVLAVICGLMGAWTGAGGSKIWRRVMIPFLLTVFAFFTLGSWWVITMMLMAAVFSLGYGIPTPPTDPGSPIGAFWYKVFGGNEAFANAFTRATIGVFLGLSVIVVPLLTGSWWPVYGVAFMLLVFNQVLWTVFITGLGQFSFMGKNLLWEEFFIYSCNAVIVMSMVVLS